MPADWVAEVEGRAAMLELADDFAAEFTARARRDPRPPNRWSGRYPGD